MATNFNSDLSREFSEGGRIQVSRDKIPDQFADKIVPVMEVNPKLLRRCDQIFSITNGTINTSATILTTPSDRDFFLCGFTISWTNDAASQASSASIVLSPDQLAASQQCFKMQNVTGVAGSQNMTCDFNRPIKIKRGTAMTATILGAAVGTSYLAVTVWGYTVDNYRA